MKNFLKIVLASFARLTLKLHHPKIIGITGSVGKTSTKEAIYSVLGSKFWVGSSRGNLNSDIGLPLSILGFQKPGGFKKNFSSFFEWLWILVAAFFRIFRFNFPEVLVLEMGSDKPGDIAYLLSITGKIDIAVITDIGISHLEFFPSPEALAAEKLSILIGLAKTGTAILNTDNTKLRIASSVTDKKVITYGFDPSDVQAHDLTLTEKDGQRGTGFNLGWKSEQVPIFLPGVVGKPAVYAVLAAAAAGISLGMSLAEIPQALKNYQQPAGRLRLIEGINHTTILDDTYNAAPSSVIAAIDALTSVPSKRKIAALGSMAELGKKSEEGHREVGLKIMQSSLDLVFLVGEEAKWIQDELDRQKFPGKVFWFPASDEAKTAIRENLLESDAVLVKGSQSARMEKIVKEIMAHPEQSKNLLVRQSNQWL